jgi:hypothetical protein
MGVPDHQNNQFVRDTSNVSVTLITDSLDSQHLLVLQKKWR